MLRDSRAIASGPVPQFGACASSSAVRKHGRSLVFPGETKRWPPNDAGECALIKHFVNARAKPSWPFEKPEWQNVLRPQARRGVPLPLRRLVALDRAPAHARSTVDESTTGTEDSGRWSAAVNKSAQARSVSIAAEALADMPAAKPKRILRQWVVRDRDNNMNS